MGKDVEEYEHCMYRSKLASAGRNEKMLYKLQTLQRTFLLSSNNESNEHF